MKSQRSKLFSVNFYVDFSWKGFLIPFFLRGPCFYHFAFLWWFGGFFVIFQWFPRNNLIEYLTKGQMFVEPIHIEILAPINERLLNETVWKSAYDTYCTCALREKHRFSISHHDLNSTQWHQCGNTLHKMTLFIVNLFRIIKMWWIFAHKHGKNVACGVTVATVNHLHRHTLLAKNCYKRVYGAIDSFKMKSNQNQEKDAH